MAAADVDAVVLSSGPNARYFTGFSGEDDRQLLVVLTSDGDPVAITPDQYVDQVRDNTDVTSVRAVPANTPTAVVTGLLGVLDAPARVRLDPNASAAVATRMIQRTDAAVGPAGDLIGPLRLTKTAPEIAALRRAADVADSVSEAVRSLGSDAVGMTERELAVEIRTRLHAAGGERLSFPVSVGAGPNGARPATYRHGDRAVRRGDPVVLDFGAFVDGYASDQTRTCVFAGDPPAAFREAYEAVSAGLEAGVAAAGPTTTAAAVDRAVRRPIAEAGLADRFGHGTGHGVGLDAHEAPVIDGDNARRLEEGMVFSIEPGVYVPGSFGVRLEDLVVVTADGCDRLNASSRTWQPL